MGWEWHERDRDLRGRFNGYGQLPEQLHVRVTRTEGQRIREAAWGAHMGISEWMRDICLRELEKRQTKPTRA